MANLLILKRRIQTAQNVSKTTRALQMISASKLKRAQEAALMGRPYVEKLTDVAQSVALGVEKENSHKYMKQNGSDKNLVVVISPDKGLCGSLVTNLSREIILNTQKDSSFVTFGRKVELNLAKLGKEIIAAFPFGTTLPSFDVVYPIVNLIDENYLNNKVGNVSILYTNFQSVFTQKAIIKTLLPIQLPREDKKEENMLFEPDLISLLPSILRHFIEMSIYQSILESYASEQSARMIAMKNATDNANDIIKELKLDYNKGRQEKITNEILDIGGATFALQNEE
ncbi:MAG TPA: ATP synthase F1 subunit gamma [Patescibacteria group bacterium]|nr:ATP synthase F1 subunit gamma [Patescibacteria group bacterium]